MPQLRLLSAHHTTQPLDVDKTVVCSPHELIAIVTQSQDVVVYRLNGQIAFSIKHPERTLYAEEDSDAHVVTCLQWSPEGRCLAVAWSDSSWNIHEAEKGEIILKGSIADGPDGDAIHVNCFDWREHKVDSDPGKISRLSASLADDQSTRIPPDLPRALTLLDVTTILPKLSALPSHGLRVGTDGARFTNQTATDDIFSSRSRALNKGCVDILAIHGSDGSIRIVMDGTSQVGTVRDLHSPGHCLAVGITHQSALAFFQQPTEIDIECSVLQLPLLELNSALLHVLAHCASQLNALVHYLDRTAQCIAHDFTTGLAYPDRLVASISMTMQERTESSATLTSALVHLAMTGQFHADIQEWLTDIVKDTGLKRWDNSMCSTYSAIQNHLHLNMLPALDRIVIATTRVRGFARLHQGSATFAPDEKLFDAILKRADALRSTVQNTLEQCISEWSLWRAFARWLRMQVEIATAVPGTKSAAEAEERESVNMVMSKVLQYTQRVLGTGSVLKMAVSASSSSTDTSQGLPLLSTLVKALLADIQTASSAITAWQGHFFHRPNTTWLQLPGPYKLRDLAYVQSSQSDVRPRILIAATSTQPAAGIAIFEIDVALLSGSRKTSGTDNTRLEPAVVLEDVVDACFTPQMDKILILRQSSELSSDDADAGAIELAEFALADGHSTIIHRPEGLKGARLIVGGRKGKEFCVIFNEDGTAWHVLDLYAAADPT